MYMTLLQEKKASSAAPKGVKMAVNLANGKFVRLEQIGQYPASTKNTQLKYAVEPADMEKMVKGSLMTQGATNSVSIHPLQISVNGAVGAEFKLTDSFSLYAEPTLNYSFDNGSSIPTLYQEKPMNFNITVGIRFNLKQ
jgi:hypothetical protein